MRYHPRVLTDPQVREALAGTLREVLVPVAFNTTTLAAGRRSRKVWGGLDLSTLRDESSHYGPCLRVADREEFYTSWYLYPAAVVGDSFWVREAHRARAAGWVWPGRWLAVIQYRADGRLSRRHVDESRLRVHHEGSFGDHETYQLGREMPEWACRMTIPILDVEPAKVGSSWWWRYAVGQAVKTAGADWRRPCGGEAGERGVAA